MTIELPTGFRVAGIHCGLKSDISREDLSLFVSDRPAVATGVYTKNRVFAAPVALDRQRTPSDHIRAVIVNSGNANACTGAQGMADAQAMTRCTADVCGCDEDDILVMSTGIIGEFLAMNKIEPGIKVLGERLGTDEANIATAARGMMTTDQVEKVFSRKVSSSTGDVRLFGVAKGAAMIGPNMATMLGLILTDSKLQTADAQRMLGLAVNESFNCISVEGHTSTNDTVLLLANGAAGGAELSGADLDLFSEALGALAVEMARSIPADGEGATHLIEIQVSGCKDRDAAFLIAKTVANSALVKTAIAGADPNWGRIVSAAGYADVLFDPIGVRLTLNGTKIYAQSAPLKFDARALSDSIRQNRDTLIHLQFSEGDAGVRFWTTDLTAEYVYLNADYHT